MTAQHTKGPWQVCEAAPDLVLDRNYRAIARASFRATPTMNLIHETKANARLIAAAPEMLEALQQIIKMNRATAQDQFGDGEQAEKWACVTVARAAIAKATGETK